MEESAVYPRILVSESILEFIKKLPSYISDQDDYIDSLIEKMKSEIKLSEAEELDILKYKQSLQFEISIKEWYLKLVVRIDENDIIFLNYLYNINFEEIFPQYSDLIKNIPEMLSKIKFLSEYEVSSLKTSIAIDLSSSVKNMMNTHKSKCLKKIDDWCNYRNVDKTNPKVIELRKRIIQKYVWIIDFHNILCAVYQLKECSINVAVSYNKEVSENELKIDNK